jgi:hypothetical protein
MKETRFPSAQRTRPAPVHNGWIAPIYRDSSRTGQNIGIGNYLARLRFTYLKFENRSSDSSNELEIAHRKSAIAR